MKTYVMVVEHKALPGMPSKENYTVKAESVGAAIQKTEDWFHDCRDVVITNIYSE